MGEFWPELTLSELLAPVRRRWWLVLLLVLGITAVVYANERSRPTSYTATTQLYYGKPLSRVLHGLPFVTFSELDSYPAVISSSENAATVAHRLGLSGPAALGGAVSATAAPLAHSITLSVSAATAAVAIRDVNGFARAWVAAAVSNARKVSRAELLKREKRARLVKLRRASAKRSTATHRSAKKKTVTRTPVKRKQVKQKQVKRGAVKRESLKQEPGVSQIDPATSAGLTHRPAAEYAAVAALVSLIGSVLLCYSLESFSTALRSVFDASGAYGQPVIATILHDPDISHASGGRATLPPLTGEAFRGLQLIVAPFGSQSTIAVTSAAPAEGRSSVARNLALACVESGQRTVVVDVNYRRPALAGRLGVASEPGLSDVVAGDVELEDAITHVATGTLTLPGVGLTGAGASSAAAVAVGADLAVMGPGPMPVNPTAMVTSAEFAWTIADLRSIYDTVILDSAPVTAASEVIPLLAQADATVIVSRNAVTDRRSARLTRSLIERAQTPQLAGVVVNDLEQSQAAVAFGSDYYGTGRGVGNPRGLRRPWARLRARKPRARSN